MDKNTIVYQLVVEEVQYVSMRLLGRELNDYELGWVNNRIGDFIDWEEAIEAAILYYHEDEYERYSESLPSQ
jgi:hypothetical protein